MKINVLKVAVFGLCVIFNSTTVKAMDRWNAMMRELREDPEQVKQAKYVLQGREKCIKELTGVMFAPVHNSEEMQLRDNKERRLREEISIYQEMLRVDFSRYEVTAAQRQIEDELRAAQVNVDSEMWECGDREFDLAARGTIDDE